MHQVLVNASNLHVGGGVQVASSFLDELAALTQVPEFVAMHPWISSGHVLASSAVLGRIQSATAATLEIEERDVTVDLRARRGSAYDLAFSVFGPVYVPPRADIHIDVGQRHRAEGHESEDAGPRVAVAGARLDHRPALGVLDEIEGWWRDWRNS